jgi:methyltransferase-like protein
MLKRLFILPVSFFCVLLLTSFSWSAVQGTWTMSGNVKATAQGKGIKTTVIRGKLDGDTWTFNEDNSFESDYVGGSWSQNKKKFAIDLNDDDIISLVEEMLSEEFETDITVDGITKETCTGTENTKKNTIKGSFKINMTGHGYDEKCNCERTGKITFSGNFTGTRGEDLSISQ